MIRFGGAREAKEFLVARIVDQAHREGISLSEVERGMLYFTETGWAPPDIISTMERFDSECDTQEYENKIAQLIRHAYDRAYKEDKLEFGAWNEAIGILAKEDHYLKVMLDQAGAKVRPPYDLLKLWMTALAILLAVLCVIYVADRLGILNWIQRTFKP